MRREALIDGSTIHVHEWITETILDFVRGEWREENYRYVLGILEDTIMLVRWTENKESNLIEWRFIEPEGSSPIGELKRRLYESNLYSIFELRGEVLEQRLYQVEPDEESLHETIAMISSDMFAFLFGRKANIRETIQETVKLAKEFEARWDLISEESSKRNYFDELDIFESEVRERYKE